MITELTEKQKEAMAEWRNHCLEIGRDTSAVNKKLTEESWSKFYDILKLKTPKFWYCQSPFQAQIIINIFPNIEKIFDNFNIGQNLDQNLDQNIWHNIRQNIEQNIGQNTKIDFIYTYSWGQHDIGWISYYKFYEKYGLLKNDKNFEIFNMWYDLACSSGWSYTFENMVFVCENSFWAVVALNVLPYYENSILYYFGKSSVTILIVSFTNVHGFCGHMDYFVPLLLYMESVLILIYVV